MNTARDDQEQQEYIARWRARRDIKLMTRRKCRANMINSLRWALRWAWEYLMTYRREYENYNS